MKRFITICLLFILALLCTLFIPREREHVVIAESSYNYSKVYLGNKLYKVKFPESYPIGSVINYKYNLFKVLEVTKLNPLTERVMIKDNDYYDFEKSGTKKLSKNPYYYYLHNNAVAVCTDKNLIVGQNNLKSYIDKKNNFKTFIISPINFSYMRVGIRTNDFKSIYHNEIDLTCMNNSTLYNIRENYFIPLIKNSKISIKYSDNKIIVELNDKKKIFKNRVYIKGGEFKINNLKRGNPYFTPVYSGKMEFLPFKDGLLVTNEVNLEEYLYKVVPSEMPSFGGIEALKCQAICARTYAISDMLENRFANLGFYVDDSTQSQVYNNIKCNDLSNAAVKETSGLIMTYNKNPIDAKYYSSSAGVGTAYEDIWFNADESSEDKKYYFTGSYIYPSMKLPSSEKQWLSFYKNKNLKSIDSDSPYFRWYAYFSKNTLEKSLVKSLKIIFDNRNDFIEIFQDSKKLKTFPKLENLQDIIVDKRSYFGNAITISFKFSNILIKVKGDYNIRSAIRCNDRFCGEPIKIIRHKGDPLVNTNFLPSSFFAIDKMENGFIIYGGGYGHGVGMSQFGAIGLSKNGEKYTEILNKFYKNIELEKIY